MEGKEPSGISGQILFMNLTLCEQWGSESARQLVSAQDCKKIHFMQNLAAQ